MTADPYIAELKARAHAAEDDASQATAAYRAGRTTCRAALAAQMRWRGILAHLEGVVTARAHNKDKP